MAKKIIVFSVLILFSVSGLVVFQTSKFNDGKLHLIFCDVGQGDAILIKTPGGKYILVDGGPDDSVLNCLSKHMPFWDRNLQVVILTHPHADHLTGLISVVRRYNLISYDTENLKNQGGDLKILQDILAVKNLSARYLEKGDSFTDQANFKLETLWPSEEYAKNLTQKTDAEATDPDSNGFCVVQLLSYVNFKALLTCDTDAATGEKAAFESGKVNVLQIPHHGSKTGLSPLFLQEAVPDLAVISVGKNNNYGHPNQATLSLLKNHNIETLRTDEKGDIEIITDGKSWYLVN